MELGWFVCLNVPKIMVKRITSSKDTLLEGHVYGIDSWLFLLLSCGNGVLLVRGTCMN